MTQRVPALEEIVESRVTTKCLLNPDDIRTNSSNFFEDPVEVRFERLHVTTEDLQRNIVVCFRRPVQQQFERNRQPHDGDEDNRGGDQIDSD